MKPELTVCVHERGAGASPAAIGPAGPEVVVVHNPVVRHERRDPTDAPTLGEVLLEKDARNVGVPTPRVDLVQDVVMTAISPDGRPPSRTQRLAEWKWFIATAVVLAFGGVAWGILSGAAWYTVAASAALVVVFVGVAIPTWGAGLLRGGEEREARKVALIDAELRKPS